MKRSFKDLYIWQRSIALSVDITKIAMGFRSHNPVLADQAIRASISIPSNIAEGHGRSMADDFARFLRIALGSVYELETHLEIACRLQLMPAAVVELHQAALAQIGARLSRLIRYMKGQRAAERNGRNARNASPRTKIECKT